MNDKQGRVFNIQRFSVEDGTGIRTTVFMKGCNLRCSWCHNPESYVFSKQILYAKDKCVMCNRCMQICPKEITATEKVESIECILCGRCVEECMYGALQIIGEDRKVSEVMQVLMRDSEFYKNSGGGVTISGGEPILQIDFVEELLKRLKYEDVHTAIDTAGNIPYENYQRILPFIDLILYDLKIMDSQKHKQYTGVHNELILENIKKLLKTGKEINIRVPLIRGVNDSIENVEQMLEIIDGYSNVTEIKLLPYHNMGRSKSENIGQKSDLFEAPSQEVIDALETFIAERRCCK